MTVVKAKALRAFRDKETGAAYKAGQEIDVSSKQRLEEMNSGKFGKLVEPLAGEAPDSEQDEEKPKRKSKKD